MSPPARLGEPPAPGAALVSSTARPRWLCQARAVLVIRVRATASDMVMPRPSSESISLTIPVTVRVTAAALDPTPNRGGDLRGGGTVKEGLGSARLG
jgi:hypothetical protein